ncbi:3,4-dihydroxy-2-butanone 4-phosphate synthase [Pyrodictium delaneyi]|uniref:3,4-dihydroxy-2-butanone 4-phosphate synthase n=1 Tax=Pyrodictium delaneyi TaxID=1273541 RepID=A0A0P0N5F8_9CREN|nr:3,4-dihydroxy-2-butanone-4-phosphate synthase [Pyrodictium delaneyi]ALL02046.1 3,4-dihydroxy-2-butanone 4-phosphate synthase [Pyrodictium delaneyi]OWJ54794.1 hypothetical protein Pdsh_03500 [Pyrodictium delaneyi]
MSNQLEKAIEAFRRGIPVLIYDEAGRENEIDYVIHASMVTTERIYEMRTLAGGLICYAMPQPAGRIVGLRYGYEIISTIPELAPLASKTLGYGDKPAFSLWVNSIRVKTGIRDSDRATTIRELDKVLTMIIHGNTREARNYFQSNFVAPGHVPILLGRRLNERKGHTELSLHLAILAGMTPSTVIVEMLSKGDALSIEDARRVSREKGYPLIEGNEIIDRVEKLGEDLYCRYNLC